MAGSVIRNWLDISFLNQSSFQALLTDQSVWNTVDHIGLVDGSRTSGCAITASNTGKLGCCQILSITLTDADIRRMAAGAMLDDTGSHGTGVDMIELDVVLIAELSWMSTRFVGALRHQTGAQYSDIEKHRAREAVRRVLALAPHFEPASLVMRLFLVQTFAAVFTMWVRKVSDRSSVNLLLGTPAAWCSCRIRFPFNRTLSSVDAEALWRWNTRYNE